MFITPYNRKVLHRNNKHTDDVAILRTLTVVEIKVKFVLKVVKTERS